MQDYSALLKRDFDKDINFAKRDPNTGIKVFERDTISRKNSRQFFSSMSTLKTGACNSEKNDQNRDTNFSTTALQTGCGNKSTKIRTCAYYKQNHKNKKWNTEEFVLFPVLRL